MAAGSGLPEPAGACWLLLGMLPGVLALMLRVLWT